MKEFGLELLMESFFDICLLEVIIGGELVVLQWLLEILLVSSWDDCIWLVELFEFVDL